MAVRRPKMLLVVLLLVVVAPGDPARASCAGPELSVRGSTADRPSMRTGSPVEAQGRFFVDGCDDTGGGSVLGCTTSTESEEVPMTGVRLVLVQGEREWRLGTADAGTGEEVDDRGRVSWRFVVPSDARPGPALLKAAGAWLRVQITDARPTSRTGPAAGELSAAP